MKPMIMAVVTLVLGLLIGSGIGIALAPSLMPSQVTPTGASTTVTTTVSSAMAGDLAKLKVGLIEPITPEDYSWNYQANYSLSLLAHQFGFNYTIAENLFDGTSAEPVATQWATSGYNVIIGQGIQYQDMFIKIAPQFPNTLFLCVDCFKGGHDGTDPGNVGDVWWYMADGAYLIGILAGNLTKSNILGLVGGGRVPSIWAGHEAFKAGALAVNPKVKFIETWMPFSWADVAGAKKAAEEAADQGADFVFSSGDGVDVGVRQAAQEKNVMCSTQYADSAHLDPAHIVTSLVVHWDIAYLSALSAYVRGDYQNIWLQADLFSGMVTLGQFGSMVPASMQTAILQQEINMRISSGLPFHLDFSCFDNSSAVITTPVNGNQPRC